MARYIVILELTREEKDSLADKMLAGTATAVEKRLWRSLHSMTPTETASPVAHYITAQ